MSILSRTARRLEAFPDTPAWFDRHLAKPSSQWLVLVALGLALRIATFGDPNLHVDEAWYFLVGQEMHHGAIPYVTIWDRKPVGLFLLYYLFAGLSSNVLAYQIPAWLFASTTAWVIARIAARWTGAQGAVLAGASYLLMLGPLEGFGGQTPVFYNLLIAAAAWLVLQSLDELDAGRPGWRMLAAMALAGTALTFKQTTMFEAAFFGLFAAYRLWRSSAPRLRAAGWITAWVVIGAAPTLVTAAWYVGHGFWPEFWQAMVLSNLAKAKPSAAEIALSSLRLLLRLYPIIAIAWLGTINPSLNRQIRIERQFAIIWIFSAILGVVIVPNFYTHYALPALAPFIILNGFALGRRDIGFFLFAFIAAFTSLLYPPMLRIDHRLSAKTMDEMSTIIRKHGGDKGLLIYDGPTQLYTMTDTHPVSRLAFPPHLNNWRERNVSSFDTIEEVRHALAVKPGVIVTTITPTYTPGNGDTREMVMAYAYNFCEISGAYPSYEYTSNDSLIVVFGDCSKYQN
ncbi:ArnT family glycosyltransferase [Novosphingobium aquiterrae]|uniref:ArnT family glycosyltransferase n=1 Tax=Novosphingobium aquiterrae TaxID=624388 RepID=A0ABV6PMT4_9SPHN